MRLWIGIVASLAALFGAAGVALAAAGAHLGGTGSLATTAAYFLLFHAAALLAAITAAAISGRPTLLLLATTLIAIGTVLFSGHLALHALRGWVPLPFAAPLGGSITILGWLVLAIALPLALSEHRGSS